MYEFEHFCYMWERYANSISSVIRFSFEISSHTFQNCFKNFEFSVIMIESWNMRLKSLADKTNFTKQYDFCFAARVELHFYLDRPFYKKITD